MSVYNFKDINEFLNACNNTVGGNLDPVLLRRVFLVLTRNYFSQPEHYGKIPDAFKKFVYSDDEKERTLDIELDFLFTPEKARKRPSIYVSIDPLTLERKAINDIAGDSDDNSEEIRVNTVDTQLVIRHICKNPDEAMMLGILSMRYYSGIVNLIKERLTLDDFKVIQLGKPELMDDKDKLFNVNLVLGMTYQYTTLISEESHRIKKISVDLAMNAKTT